MLRTASVAVIAFATAANADILNLTASLDGFQETPPVATTGAGSAVMTLDTATNMFSLVGSFQNLIGTTTAAHVHGPAPIGVAAGVIIPITIDLGVSSGNFSFNGLISAANAQTIIAGLAYINVHTNFRPGGEIRGQIVPAPSVLALLSLGGAVLVRRRR
jgi:hypothetical protein